MKAWCRAPNSLAGFAFVVVVVLLTLGYSQFEADRFDVEALMVSRDTKESVPGRATEGGTEVGKLPSRRVAICYAGHLRTHSDQIVRRNHRNRLIHPLEEVFPL